MSAGCDPTKILETGFGFWPSQVLLSAVSLGLFTELGDETLTARALGERLKLNERAWVDFFDTLVALGLLERAGRGDDARYSNSRETAAFMDKTRPEYLGGILEMAHDRLYPFWADLTEALQTGRPQNEIKHTGKPVFEELYSDPKRLEQFLEAMAGISRGNYAALVEKFDFSPYRSLCDIGGATGLLCALAAQRHGHLACTSFDLPAVTPLAARKLETLGLKDRVKVVSGDFLKEPLPKTDVIVMGMILHDWNLDGKMHLIRAAHAALPDNGAFIVVENLIDNERRENAFGMMMSLNMLIEFGDAFDFTGEDFAGWCRSAGFRKIETLHLNGPCSAAIAYK